MQYIMFLGQVIARISDYKHLMWHIDHLNRQKIVQSEPGITLFTFTCGFYVCYSTGNAKIKPVFDFVKQHIMQFSFHIHKNDMVSNRKKMVSHKQKKQAELYFWPELLLGIFPAISIKTHITPNILSVVDTDIFMSKIQPWHASAGTNINFQQWKDGPSKLF